MFPGVAARSTATSAATRTSRCSRRCSATSARSRQAQLKDGEARRLPAAGRDGAGRDRAELRPLPEGHRRLRPAHRQLARASRRARSQPTVLPQAGQHAAAHDRRQRPARRRAGAPRRRSRAARVAGETYADGGAIVALDPRTGAVLALASNPTYQPSVYVSRDPSKLAPLQNAKVAAAKNYPGAQPRDRRLLSARLGVEARHGARGDGGGNPVAEREHRLHAGLHSTTSSSSTTGIRTSTSRWS